MLLNKQELFSDAQAIPVTLNAATDSTNTLDFRSHGDDIDKELRWFVLLTDTATSAGNATLQITWQTSANNSDWETLLESADETTDTLSAGKFVLNAPLPTGIKRYNRMLYTIGTANFTVAAKFTAGIVRGLVDQKFAGL